MKAPVIPHGFHVAGGRAERFERWREKKEASAFEELVTELRRKLMHRGVCRWCAREVPLTNGSLGSITRYHLDGRGAPCIGRGRSPA